MPKHAIADTELDALLRLEVACNLALKALPKLPTDTEQALRDHVQTLCDVTGRELDRLKPGWRRDASQIGL
jgi:hypothetical protein